MKEKFIITYTPVIANLHSISPSLQAYLLLHRHCEPVTTGVAIHLYVFSGSPQSLSLLRDDEGECRQSRDNESKER